MYRILIITIFKKMFSNFFEFPSTEQGKKALLLGALIGVVAGAFLPDAYNPVEIVKKTVSNLQNQQ
ncbi:hypothetical protein MY04_1118 [Flammeovirga sp. MY04]|uniref:hypothetical protein n=1 Tax=Flammeovirga sp. MY04 TaxID=1191459 RepID=UPI001305429C|nr:hypothetical protein [Flammeovirga sp. MY04]ANQ48495.2 hypothetical protein MY04_1118 [Flammeovirga sp. MY04]